MFFLPNAIYRFNENAIKTSVTFFTEINKRILKFVWNHKRSQIPKEVLRKKIKTEGITLLDIKLHYKAIIMKTKWYRQINGIDRWNIRESPEINSRI